MLSKLAVASACFALVGSIAAAAAAAAAGAGDAQTADRPQFGAWGLDLSAMADEPVRIW
ncbi:MAG TPA: hypothetical protein VGI32_07300 [Steroidobacteraceae bacterium]|jgi:hypothetical protein